MLRRILGWANPEIALGFVVASVFWIGVLGWQAAYAPTEMEKQKCYEATQKSGHKSEECKTLWEKTTTDPIAFFTFWLVIFTGVLGFSTVLLWRASEHQAELTQAALIGDQRAWIMVSLNIESFRFGPIVDGAADAEAELIFRIQNVGRTPAINATFNFELIGNFSTPATPIREFAETHNTCDEFDGRLISPGEDYTVERTAGAPGSELYQYGRRGLVAPLIVGCVTYQILQDGRIHQTAFAYGVERWDEDSRVFVHEGDLDVNSAVAAVAPGGFIT